jgi:pimeloyl-ACP methyl ester carboxylesterase
MRLTLPALGLLLVVAATAPALAVQPMDDYFTAHDGVKIHYLEAGNKNGPGAPVVLIHGYTGTALGNWFTNGIADALIGRHWVVAIDCRGHGKSDKPHDPAKYGPQMAEDVVELMDHLKIEKAHIGGYSMGGFITGQLLAKHPERFITAVFGGSGVPEVEAEWKEKVPTDKKEKDPKEDEASKKLRGIPDRDQEALDAVFRYPWKPGERTNIDLTKIKIPVLAINGEFDKPNAKTHRMQRELVNFKSVVLPGKSHLTAIMPGYIPKEYIDTLAAFIDANDRQP